MLCTVRIIAWDSFSVIILTAEKVGNFAADFPRSLSLSQSEWHVNISTPKNCKLIKFDVQVILFLISISIPIQVIAKVPTDVFYFLLHFLQFRYRMFEQRTSNRETDRQADWYDTLWSAGVGVCA